MEQLPLYEDVRSGWSALGDDVAVGSNSRESVHSNHIATPAHSLVSIIPQNGIPGRTMVSSSLHPDTPLVHFCSAVRPQHRALPSCRQSTHTDAASTNRPQLPPRNSLIERLGLNTVKALKAGLNAPTFPNGHHPDPPTKQREARAQPTIKPCSLRAMPPTTRPLPLQSMDWDEVVWAFSRCKIQHTSRLLTLKVIPSSSIPSSSDADATIDHHGRTPFAIVTSIKSISKKAVMRNRVRTRFKEAVRLVITRDVDVNVEMQETLNKSSRGRGVITG